MAPGTKPVDFKASARRHLRDADLLEQERRVANAGHLYGCAAECGVKALLVGQGIPTDPDGSPMRTSGVREHVNRLVGAVSSRLASKYLAVIPNIQHFDDWRIDHRYYAEAAIPTSLQKWKAAACEVGIMLDQAELDGAI